jgi:hypothetical protein
MTYARREEVRLCPASITSGNQNRYLRDNPLPMRLQALMVQIFNSTDWVLRERGYMQTKPIKYGDLARSLCCSVRTVIRNMKELVALGEVVIHSRFAASGRQVQSILTLPKLAGYISRLKTSDIAKELEQPIGAAKAGQTRGDTDDAPSKQKSSSKMNTYIRFKNIFKKDEFLELDGSIQTYPQITSIIKRARPGIDPDIIYGFFREFIAADGFQLKKHIPHYFALLRMFARTCRLPGSKRGSELHRQEPTRVAPEPLPIPQDPGVVGEAKRLLLKHLGDLRYRNWFAELHFEEADGCLKLGAKSTFVRSRLLQEFDRQLDQLSHALGLTVKVELQGS